MRAGAPVAGLDRDRRRRAERAEGRTRDAVVNLLLADGPLTAADLAAAAGHLAGRRPPAPRPADRRGRGQSPGRPPALRQRGRGRPARSYLLTDAGRARLPHAYDQLAVQALDYLAEAAGPEAVDRFRPPPGRGRRRPVPRRAGRRRRCGRPGRGAGRGADRGRLLRLAAAGRRRRSSCASTTARSATSRRSTRSCARRRWPSSPATLGTYAQRLATIARGDAVCTTFIPISTIPPHAMIPAHQHPPHHARQPAGQHDSPLCPSAPQCLTGRTSFMTTTQEHP